MAVPDKETAEVARSDDAPRCEIRPGLAPEPDGSPRLGASILTEAWKCGPVMPCPRVGQAPLTSAFALERATGIEPAFSAWEADVLPLNYARGPTTLASRPYCDIGVQR